MFILRICRRFIPDVRDSRWSDDTVPVAISPSLGYWSMCLMFVCCLQGSVDVGLPGYDMSGGQPGLVDG